MLSKRRILAFLVCFSMSLFFNEATAFEVWRNPANQTVLKWPNNKITALEWRLNPDAFTAIPQAQLGQIFQDAFQEWAKLKCATIGFVYRGPTTTQPVRGDTTNVVGFPGNFAATHGSGIVFVPSMMYNQQNQIIELDIAINPTFPWSTTPGSGDMDLISMAMVAGGWMIGLKDSLVADATMAGTFTYGNTKRRTLHPDDITGACTLYPSGQPQCSGNADCPSGLSCQQAQCIVLPPDENPNNCKPCTTNQDCGANMACDFIGSGNFCVQYCSPDNLCPTGYSCNGQSFNSQCLPPGAVCKGSACQNDADCPAPQRCVNSKCDIVPTCRADGDCPLRHSCINGTCQQTGCLSDNDCTAPKRCVSGSCQDIAGCRSDNDCPAGKRCQNGICNDPTTGCTTSADCRLGEVCEQGTCRAAQSGCRSDADCKAGEKCEQGACKAAQSGCASDADCPANHRCENTQCILQGGQACTPGATRACTCTDGKNGSQSCKGDASGFDACVCQGGQVCTPGASQACTCTDGKSGTQLCKGDASGFDACVCSGGGQACIPGASQACVCTDGRNGSQSCNADGQSFAPCVCTGGNPPKGCQSAAQCPAGQECRNGQCEAVSTGCRLASDCAAGQNCLNGQCVNNSVGSSGCNCAQTHDADNTTSFFLALLLLGCLLRRRRSTGSF